MTPHTYYIRPTPTVTPRQRLSSARCSVRITLPAPHQPTTSTASGYGHHHQADHPRRQSRPLTTKPTTALTRPHPALLTAIALTSGAATGAFLKYFVPGLPSEFLFMDDAEWEMPDHDVHPVKKGDYQSISNQDEKAAHV